MTLCPACSDGSCEVCGGAGEIESPAAPPYAATVTPCANCHGTGVCPNCDGEVALDDPHEGARLPILPNPDETWADILP